jgi:RNA recognition motif-containing protein
MRIGRKNNAGYCFVDFSSPAIAAKALTLNGTMILNVNRPFKLNWASMGDLADRRYFTLSSLFLTSLTINSRDKLSIFIGNLESEVNEYVLVSLFQNRFPSYKSAEIITDLISGMSRRYGFVRFSKQQDQKRALTEM